MAADGKIVIDMSLDTDDIKNSLNSVEKASENAAKNIESSFDNITKSASEAFEYYKDGISYFANNPIKLNVEDSQNIDKVIDILRNYDSVIEELTNKISDTSDEIDNLNRLISLYGEEAPGDAEKWEARIDELRVTYSQLNSELDLTIAASSNLNDSIENVNTVYSKNQNAVQDTTRAVINQTNALQSLNPEQNKAADETKNHEREQKSLEKQLEVTQAAMVNYIAQGISQAISAMDNLVDSTLSFRQETSFLEANLQHMGVSLDDSSQYLSRFGAVSSDVSQNIGALSNLLQAGFEGDNLASAIDSVSGAIIAYPDQNVERIAEGIQRTFGQNEAVGNFRELILRTGGDVESFNRQLQRANTDAQRQQVILRELERQGLTPLVESYRENNEALVSASEAQLQYNEASARLGEALQPGRTALQELQSSILTVIANIAEANPVLTEVTYIVLNIGAILLSVVGAINLFKKTFSGLPSLFGNIGKTATSAGQGAQTLGKGMQDAGQQTKQANFEFLSIAAGIALIAAGVSIAILAISELVRAFSTTNGNMIESAAAIAIVIGAITVMISALTLLYKVVGDNSTQFVIYSAAILVIASAFSLMFVALSTLVDKMNEGQGSFLELARGISDIITAMTLAIVTIASLGMLAGQTAPQLLIFATAILAVAAAVFLLAAAFALLSGRSITIPNVPTTPTPRGYARGTASAKRGYNWVDETSNPALLWFNGGEKVLTSAQANAQRSAQTSNSTQNVYNIGSISIPANNVKSFVDIVNIMENEASSYKQGYTGR